MSAARRAASASGFSGLTPMLDVLFILLFALLALSDVRSSNRSELLRIELPRVEPGEQTAVDDVRRIEIVIDSESRVRSQEDDSPIESVADLERLLQARLGDALPDQVVIEIQADREAHHGVAVELLQLLRNRGFVRVELVALGLAEGSEFLGGSSR